MATSKKGRFQGQGRQYNRCHNLLDPGMERRVLSRQNGLPNLLWGADNGVTPMTYTVLTGAVLLLAAAPQAMAEHLVIMCGSERFDIDTVAKTIVSPPSIYFTGGTYHYEEAEGSLLWREVNQNTNMINTFIIDENTLMMSLMVPGKDPIAITRCQLVRNQFR
jgi:hypothetical protein